MRTWLVLAAVLTVAAVAAADALRGSLRDGGAQRESPGAAERRIVPPGAPSGLMGAVFYSDPRDECRLKTLSVAGFAGATPPDSTACRFSVSPSGQIVVPGRAEWSPAGGRFARSAGRVVEVRSADSSQVIRFPGRAAAFRPDGTITYTSRGVLVERTTECQAGARLFTDPGDNATARCIRTVYPHRVTSAAWFTNTRFAAVLRRGVLVIVDDGTVVVRARLPPHREARLSVSPRRSFVSVWLDGRLSGTFDAGGGPVTMPPIPTVQALAWAPSERWAIIATEKDSAYLFRPNTGDARLRRLDISARDVAWR